MGQAFLGMTDFDPFAEEEEVLVPSEPVEANPPLVEDEEVPPTPAFLIHENKFGPGAHGVYFADGTPVGVWLHEQHPTLDAAGVRELLSAMGLDDAHAGDFARQRALRDEKTAEVAALPGVRSLALAEAVHSEQTEAVRAAFLAAQRKKEK